MRVYTFIELSRTKFYFKPKYYQTRLKKEFFSVKNFLLSKMQSFQKKKILIIAGDYSENYEVLVPYQALLMVGHDVHIVCPNKKKGDTIKTAVHQKEEDCQTYTETRGHNFFLNYDFDAVKEDEYDGLYLPGGRAPEYLRLNERVLAIARHFIEKDKPLGVICHGISILTALNALKGRKVTSYAPFAPEIMLCGGEYQDIGAEDACADGNLVSGKAWNCHPKFLKLYLEKLGTGFAQK